MSVINILDQQVADMIAAGEVVERPASVVKELMENSFDAGATAVTVEIERGGMGCIRITDNGSGMHPEDAGIAFMRHATSKLRDARGLEAISTMGFRGEALAAISAVSKIQMVTRHKEDEEGVTMSLTAGEIDEMLPCGCPSGTTIAVRGLFFNTPARLKFMKSDRVEGGACVQTAMQSALAHPEISVRVMLDGKEQFFSPGDGNAASCVYTLLGREMSNSLLKLPESTADLRVSGFISAPYAARGNRSAQYFFVNGRPFRSMTVRTALENAYKNSIMVGRFPAAVLYITIPYGRVDVNVHPTKAEVKFSDEKAVYDLIYYAALSALEGAQPKPELKLTLKQPTPEYKASSRPLGSPYGGAVAQSATERAPAAEHGERPVGFSRPLGSPYGGAVAQSATERAPAAEHGERPVGSSRPLGSPLGGAVAQSATERAPAAEHGERPVGSSPAAIPGSGALSAPLRGAPPPKGEASGAAERTGSAVEEEIPIRVIGEALNTYILAEQGDELLLIDKHAAHERMLFNRLREQKTEVMSQQLIVPVTMRCTESQLQLMEENSDLLEQAGFEIEPFGTGCVIIRAVPYDADGDEQVLVEEILERLRTGNIEDRRDELLHTIACKAAIKAGSRSDMRELEVLAKAVAADEVRYCPHGRPVCVRLSKKELDKKFGRIV